MTDDAQNKQSADLWRKMVNRMWSDRSQTGGMIAQILQGLAPTLPDGAEVLFAVRYPDHGDADKRRLVIGSNLVGTNALLQLLADTRADIERAGEREASEAGSEPDTTH